MGRILAAVLLLLLLACDNETKSIRVAENATPIAEIDVPDEVGRFDLVRFSAEKSRDPDGKITQYTWTFGDGGTVTASTAIAFHTYNELGIYTVSLEVVDDREAKANATKNITVVSMPNNQPPVARIQAPVQEDPGVPVLFDGSMSQDPDGSISDYQWTFGTNGPTATGVQVSHTFTAVDMYDVVLKVTDDRGANGTATHTIEIGTGTVANLPPVANAGPDQTVGIGVAVSFDGGSSFDPDGQIVSYEWNFGDGSTGTGTTASHTYNVEATFSVTLTVTDDGGLQSTDTMQVTTGQDNYDGVYTMEANPSTGKCGILPADFVATTVTFTSTGTTLHADQPDPEDPNLPPVRMSGTITGASFSVNGLWTDSSTADHDMTLTGQFGTGNYTGTFLEAVGMFGTTVCSVTWNVSGTKIQ